MTLPVHKNGFVLLEPLIAIVLLSFGVLALAHFQIKSIAQATDNRSRMSAVAQVEGLLTLVRLDATNKGCYVLPSPSSCSVNSAQAQAQEWLEGVKKEVPGYASASAETVGANQFKVRISWTSKAFKEARYYEALTDLR